MAAPLQVGPWVENSHRGGPDTYWTRTSAKGTCLAEVYGGEPATWVLFTKRWPPGHEPPPRPAWQSKRKEQPRMSGEEPDLAEAMCFVDSLLMQKGYLLDGGE